MCRRERHVRAHTPLLWISWDCILAFAYVLVSVLACEARYNNCLSKNDGARTPGTDRSFLQLRLDHYKCVCAGRSLGSVSHACFIRACLHCLVNERPSSFVLSWVQIWVCEVGFVRSTFGGDPQVALSCSSSGVGMRGSMQLSLSQQTLMSLGVTSVIKVDCMCGSRRNSIRGLCVCFVPGSPQKTWKPVCVCYCD